jgi:spermidine synthase
MSRHWREFRIALALAAVSGCAGLAHELLWTRRLIDLLGASAASSTRVFSCFFLGLAVGAAFTPSIAKRVTRPWLAIALAELGVAVLAIPALMLPLWSGWIWPALGPEALVGWPGATLKLVTSVLVVFPPAFCMGLVLPLLARAVLHDQLELGRHGVWLYSVNTIGGVVGLGGVTLFGLHQLGAAGSMLLAIGLNLVVVAGCLVLHATRPALPAMPRRQRQPQSSPTVSTIWPVYILAFVSGFGILAFEVLALQLVALSSPLSFYAPASVLMVVILLLGLAGLMVPYLVRRFGSASQLLSVGLLGSAFLLAAAPLCFYQLVQWIELGRKDTLLEYLAVLFGTTFLSLGPAVLLAGIVFPAVVVWFSVSGHDRYGQRWGWLLAVNGIGGLLGAEVTYRFLLPTVGVHRAVGVIGLLYAMAALGWGMQQGAWAAKRAAWPLATIGMVAIAIIFPLRWLPHINPSGILLLDQQIGREGAVAVVDSLQMGRRIIMSNQYVLGGTKYRYDQERLTHIPLMLHPDPQRVMCIGLATGITPGAALEHSEVDSLTSVELSPLVVRAADQYFGDFNHQVTQDQRAHVVVEDARTYLAAATDRYDVVVGDLFLPWAAGEARLYTLEHFQSVRESLKSGGLYCQWLAAYQLTPDHFDIIRDTFCRVFPQAFVFRDTFNCRFPAIGLVGFRDTELDWNTVRQRCDEVRRSNELGDPVVRHVEGIAMMYLGPTHDNGGPINTLSNMRLELESGRLRLIGKGGNRYLEGDRWLAFVAERYLAASRSASESDATGRSIDLTKLAWLGQRLTIWDALQRYENVISPEEASQLPAAREQLIRDFPSAIRSDQQADWNRWPGDVTLWQEPR